MNNTFKKLLFITICLIMVSVSIVIGGNYSAELFDNFAVKASATETSGKCGDNLTWTFDDTSKTLTISGTGAMYDYSDSNPAPWYNSDCRNNIKTVIIGSNVSYIGSNAFKGCSSLSCMIFETTETFKFAEDTFKNCEKLTNIFTMYADWLAVSDFYSEESDPTIYGYDIADIDENSAEAANGKIAVKITEAKNKNGESVTGKALFCSDMGDEYVITGVGENVTLKHAKTSLSNGSCSYCGNVINVKLSTNYFTYNGDVQRPAVTVSIGENKLTGGTDYTVTYSDNVNAGTAKVTVNGKGNYGGSIETDFTINKRTVTLTSATDRKIYDGTPLTNATVTVGGDGFVRGEGVTTTVTGTLTDAGSIDNTFTYKLNSSTKASNYEIQTINGTLTVNKKSLEGNDILFSAKQNSDGTLNCTLRDEYIGKDIIKSAQISYATRDGKPVSVLASGQSCIVTATAKSNSNYEGRKSIEVYGTIFTLCKCLDGTPITDSPDLNSASTNVNGKTAVGERVKTNIYAVDISNAIGSRIKLDAEDCTEDVRTAVYGAYGDKVVDFVGFDIHITDETGNEISGSLSYPMQLHFNTPFISGDYSYAVFYINSDNVIECDSVVYKDEEGTYTIGWWTNHFSKYVIVKLLTEDDQKMLFADRKAELISMLDTLGQSHTSRWSQKIISEATESIENYAYDESKSFDENVQAINAIKDDATEKVNSRHNFIYGCPFLKFFANILEPVFSLFNILFPDKY